MRRARHGHGRPGRPPAQGRYPLIDILAATGIRGLYEYARRGHGYAPRREAYLTHCDLCTDIRRFLFDREAHAYRDLAPAGFYA